MKIAVVDDERPSRSELCYLLNELVPDAKIHEAESGALAVELAANNKFDIFFLDISLGDMSGITLATMLRQTQPMASIVFSTAYSEYATKAFDLSASDYIMKPYSKSRVQAAIEKSCRGATREPSAVASTPRPEKLAINVDKNIVMLNIPDIIFIEKEDRTCRLHANGGTYSTSSTLELLEKQLAGRKFLRIHKSYIVNLDYIAEISPWFNNTFSARLSVPEKTNLPISRKYMKSLREIMQF